MAELQGLQLSYGEFARRGAKVLAIVVDSPEQNAAVVRDLGLQYPILSDPALKAIDAYGLRHPHGGPERRDISRPATFLLDAQGIIRWRNLTDNYRIRPRPDAILSQIDALGRKG